MTKPLSKVDVERFYMSRNEIASQNNNKLELEAMSRVRAYLVDFQDEVEEVKEEKPKTKAKK